MKEMRNIDIYLLYVDIQNALFFSAIGVSSSMPDVIRMVYSGVTCDVDLPNSAPQNMYSEMKSEAELLTRDF